MQQALQQPAPAPAPMVPPAASKPVVGTPAAASARAGGAARRQPQLGRDHGHGPSSSSSSSASRARPGNMIPSLGTNGFLHTGEYRFALEVAQQPVRARMCGFGDKDRRQITPPPCVRLRIFNARTGLELTDIMSIDTSFYALVVELWSVDMSTNMSLVHPSGQIYHPSRWARGEGSAAAAAAGAGAAQYPYPTPQYYPGQAAPSAQYYPAAGNAGGGGGSSSLTGAVGAPGAAAAAAAATASASSAPPTRNLIGSLVATAYKLHDLSDTVGIWFILQDLSVRTEGEFRLKFSFVNLADAVTPSFAAAFAGADEPPKDGTSPPTSSSSSSSSSSSASAAAAATAAAAAAAPQLTTDPAAAAAPMIATIFSEPFRSYSAKKFPGVIDSTDLSRCFATQGIKIPIRREHRPKRAE